MGKTTKNMTFFSGEIVKVSEVSGKDDYSFHVYVLRSDKKEGVITSYAVLPIHIIPNNKSGQQLDLELLRTQRGHISDRINSPEHKEQHYRATLQLESIPAQGNWKLTKIDRITDIGTQKEIEKKLLQSLEQSNFSLLNGRPQFIRGIDESRAMSKTKDAPYYIDIDVLQAAAAGFIPKSVAKILKQHGKINRLGTAADIANDQDADKLRQIYDKTLPDPKITFDYFARSIKKGMASFSEQVIEQTKALQERLPQGVTLKYPSPETVKFKFVERRPDLSLTDAFLTHGFITEEDTYKTLKAGKFGTMQVAAEAIEKHGIAPLQVAYRKANISKKPNPLSLSEILEDFYAAHGAFEETIAHPKDYTPFPSSTQTAYPVPEAK